MNLQAARAFDLGVIEMGTKLKEVMHMSMPMNTPDSGTDGVSYDIWFTTAAGERFKLTLERVSN